MQFMNLPFWFCSTIVSIPQPPVLSDPASAAWSMALASGHPRHIEAIFTQRRNHSKISPPAVSDNVFNMWTYTIIRLYAIPNDFNLKCSMSHLILFSFITPTALCIKTYMSSFHGVWDRECVSTITAKVFLGKSRQLLRKPLFSRHTDKRVDEWPQNMPRGGQRGRHVILFLLN